MSTYIAQSFGWSKPVWNLFAHTMMRFSSVSKSSAVRVSATPFTLASVTSSPSTSSLPEKATMIWHAYFCCFMYSAMAR